MHRYLPFALVIWSACSIQQPLTNSVSIHDKICYTNTNAWLTVCVETHDALLPWVVIVSDTSGKVVAQKGAQLNVSDSSVNFGYVEKTIFFDSLNDSIPLKIAFRCYSYYSFDTIINPLLVPGFQLYIRPVVNHDVEHGCRFTPVDGMERARFEFGDESPLNRVFTREEIHRLPAPR